MKVLWFSRYTMTQDQLDDLRRIYGEDLEVKQVSSAVVSYKDILTVGDDCDVLAALLPPTILADLTNPRNNQKPVIRAIVNRVPTGNKITNPATGKLEDEFKSEHGGWERVKIEVVTERL
mgnify:FL=1